jgi:glycosyltransferase involved in cell wall biosynthesis
MKRVLLVMMQPPGCTGVQALVCRKLLPYVEFYGWELHFAGPSPGLVSVLTEDLDYPHDRLHYSSQVSFSKRFSVRKNRCKKKSIGFFANGLLQLFARSIERLFGHDSDSYLLEGIRRAVMKAEREIGFDLIAGKTPDFRVLLLVSQLAADFEKPYLALIDDPYGARDEEGFYPKDPELQCAVLNQSSGAIFMSPLTKDRYINADLISTCKAYQLTDSYPESPELYEPVLGITSTSSSSSNSSPLKLIHLGMLPEWRPVEPLLEALHQLAHSSEPTSCCLELSIYGFLYASARQKIHDDPLLSRLIHLKPMVSYIESHRLAAKADLQLVVIGPRHLDNYPSKFFEYLGHGKPVLVLGPLQNPLKEIVDQLGIGLFVDVKDSEAIHAALKLLRSHYAVFQQAYLAHASEIQFYSSRRVAERFCAVLEASVASR